MSCPKCGSALATGAAACPVCDPWAAPSGAVAAPANLAAIPVRAKVPSWIRRTAGRNPPAHADLEKAWRNSVIVGSLTVVFTTFATAAVAAGYLAHFPGLAAACVGVAAVALLCMLGTALVVRKNFWLGRAIAVVGTRPDIGYAGFARLPGIVRLTRMLLATRVLIFSFALLSILVLSSRSVTTLNIVSCVYLLLLVCAGALHYVFQASARRELARLLSR